MRRVSLTLLILGLSTSGVRSDPRDMLAPKSVRSQALRDAVRSRMDMRGTAAVPGRQAVLAKLYDGLRKRSTPIPSSGRFSQGKKRLWIEYAFGLPSRRNVPVSNIRFETSPPALGDRAHTVVSNAFGSIRTLLDIAWGGRWTGKTSLRAWKYVAST